MRPRYLGFFASVSLLAIGLSLRCPDVALAHEGTGTTEVMVQAGPDWGQSTKTVKIVDAQGPTLGDLAQTGDPTFWIPVGLAGAALASGGLLLLKRNDNKKDGEGHDEQ